jgi:hypothetical protein
LITIPANGHATTPFGDGLASQRISRAITTLLGKHPASPSGGPSPALKTPKQLAREASKP